MSDKISIICSLTGCTEEDAVQAYDRTEDTVEAVDMLLARPVCVSNKYIESKKKNVELTETQKHIAKIRDVMKKIDENRLISSGQREHEGTDVKLIPHEETVLQNSYSQECQIPVLESEAQKQETVCR